ncbi:hypothetical protein H0H93_016178 [Arthromyces matolae]|nr:hypothetical protein H0H93_016178 [Arthromyces matolae]
MPRRAHIRYVSLHSSLVNLPISIYGPLLERNIRPQHLAIHIKLVSTQEKNNSAVEAYVGWTGLASASSLTHFSSSQNSENVLETIEIDPQFAQGLGLSQGDLVEIGLLHDLSLAKSVATEPLTSDDWDIIASLLDLVRVAKVGQEIDVWVMGRTRVRLKIVGMEPPKGIALLLTTNTEVSIAPKLHPSDRRMATANSVGGEKKGASYDNLTVPASETRLSPPPDPTASSASAPPAPPPVPRVIVPSASGKDLTDIPQPDDVLFVGSLVGIPDGHLVFPAAPTGVEDWDILTYANIAFVDASRYTESPISTVKSLLQYWLDRAIWHRPSVLILDNLDKLIGAELEHEDSFRTRQITELFLSFYSESSRSVRQNTRGVLLVATATSTASLHPLVNSAHIFKEEVQLKPPNNDARRDIIKSITEERLASAQDIHLDSKSPLNYTDLATRTEGYSVIDLQDLVSRAVHEVAIRAASGIQPVYFTTSNARMYFHCITLLQAVLYSRDFVAAQIDFIPHSLRDVKLQHSDVAWSDIGGTNLFRLHFQLFFTPPKGLHECREVLRETLEWPTKLLLYGFPGCGKTLLASAVAKECGLNFISVKGPEILNKYIGASEKSVRDLFERASAAKPCVLFFDEFDAIAPKRGHDSTGVTDRVVNQLLTQMDGAEGLDGVYVLAATSRPDLIDSALLRPGRLDKMLLCGMPDLMDRKEILEAVGRRVSTSSSVDWEEIASKTEGFSGADLQALVYNAHLDSIHRSIQTSSDIKVTNPLFNDDGPVLFKVFGGGLVSEHQSKAEQSSLEKRLRQITRGSQERSEAVKAIVSDAKKHEITSEHLHHVLKTLRPSVSLEERSRLDIIYRAFMSDRSSTFPVPPEVGGVGQRVSLA